MLLPASTVQFSQKGGKQGSNSGQTSCEGARVPVQQARGLANLKAPSLSGVATLPQGATLAGEPSRDGAAAALDRLPHHG